VPVRCPGGGYSVVAPAKRKRPRAPTPPDAIVISDSDSEGDAAPTGPPRSTAARDATRQNVPKSSSSLAVGRTNGTNNGGYHDQDTMQRQWKSGGSQHDGQKQAGLAGSASLAKGSQRSNGGSASGSSKLAGTTSYETSSKSHGALNEAGRRSGSKGQANKRQKKQHSSVKAYSVDSDSLEVVTSGTGAQSAQSSTLAHTPKEVIAPDFRAWARLRNANSTRTL
jgi:hypothetical protein